jgi:hypothetical protein
MSAKDKNEFKIWLDTMHGYGLLLHITLKQALRAFKQAMTADTEQLNDDANQ